MRHDQLSFPFLTLLSRHACLSLFPRLAIAGRAVGITLGLERDMVDFAQLGRAVVCGDDLFQAKRFAQVGRLKI